jgi:hypothetical protein
MPVIIWSPQNHYSNWKCLNTGSGAQKYGDKHWCHLYPCTGNKIAYYYVEENRCVIIESIYFFIFNHLSSSLLLLGVYYFSCDSCIAKNKPKCYHWRVGDEDSVIGFQEELRERMEEYLESIESCVKEIKKQSKRIYNPTEINH